jgi:hypothetical protein
MPLKLICNKCEIEVKRFSDLHKINNERFCKKCYQEHRKNRREETIEISGIKEELNELSLKMYREYNSKWRIKNKEIINTKQREKYHRLNPDSGRYSKFSNRKDLPVIRGSKQWKRNHRPAKSNSYLTQFEKQRLFGMLIKQGLTYDDADERVKNLVNKQAEIRESLKLQNKTEEEIKLKQQEMLEELFNYPDLVT